MEEIFAILKQIWDLPWYKVIAVAIMDDGLVFLKLWPLWIILILVVILVSIINN